LVGGGDLVDAKLRTGPRQLGGHDASSDDRNATVFLRCSAIPASERFDNEPRD
jgi:hypothetical protein